jgi:pimeloyl-ACP methyl ester carboxylesterase
VPAAGGAVVGADAAAPGLQRHRLLPSELEPRLVREAAGTPARASALRTPVTGALAAGAAPCPNQSLGVLCTDVVVPLDRSGQVPGTVSLHVEYLPAVGTPRGAVFLVAGGPGQGSAGTFGLTSPSVVDEYRYLFPGYTLVAFDNRGTGASGVLRCPGLQAPFTTDQQGALMTACAASLGSSRAFYGTDEHVEDTDAVRAALGLDKIALYGVSYGTKLATAYAYAHPARVERLVLDSVVPPDRDDAFNQTTLQAIPGAWAGYCAGGLCRAASADPGGDIVRLANRLGAKPLQGTVRRPNGSVRKVKILGVDFVNMVVQADLDPGLAAELPAVVKAALAGNTQPLLRAFDLYLTGSTFAAEELSIGLLAATNCADGPHPWGPTTPVAQRSALVKSAFAALPPGAVGPFGPWTIQGGLADFCLTWPPPTGAQWLGAGPLPDVPVMVVNGGFDMRTPVSGAKIVASRFRQATTIVVPGVGHSVLGADPTFCAFRAVRSWVLGEPFTTTCARPQPYVETVPAFPPAARKLPATPAQTLAIATKTVHDAESIWFTLLLGGARQASGVFGGKLVMTDEGFRLQRYSIATGIELSGTVRVTELGPPYAFDGVVSVTGAKAATGLLGYEDGTLGGTLGGAIVGR